ncbi:MAG: hypothetical protein IPK69_00005 [Phycisphaerales bacterium]|nr:MAG: hypothetical protein IPK69_00005 [Phycisphaerales bacterium]
MRNAIIFKVDLDGGDKPLSATKLVATFTLTASHKNTQDLLLSDGKTDPIEVAPGTQYYFERVNLADLLVKSKGGETVFVESVMAIKLGMEAALKYKTGGQAGAGAWTALGNTRDVTLNLEAGEADVTTRANSGWRATVATLKEASVEFEMVWDTGDAGFTAIKNAFFNNDPIGLQILDASAGQGLQADFSITNFSRSEALEEAITVSVTAKVTYSATAPSWIGS